jgi:hypothetical protein
MSAAPKAGTVPAKSVPDMARACRQRDDSSTGAGKPETTIARAVARVVPTLLVVALLAATAAAFAVTERLKLTPSPIADTRIQYKVFSPTCECEKGRTRVRFRLREADRLTVSIVDDGGNVVRELADEQKEAGRVAFSWDGRDDDGRVVAEGVYRPLIHFESGRRTIELPNDIRVDTTPPRVLGVRLEPAMISPDGDGRNDKVEIRYRMSERAHALVFLGDRRVVRGRGQQPDAKVDWFGRIDGRPLRAGLYALAVAAEDTAGNVGGRRETPLRIRYVELARDVVRARATFRFGVRVLTDAETVRWRFARGRGTARRGLLVLRAPRRPGTYTLFVEANGRADRARVVVRAARGG